MREAKSRLATELLRLDYFKNRELNNFLWPPLGATPPNSGERHRPIPTLDHNQMFHKKASVSQHLARLGNLKIRILTSELSCAID
jgi:hypothetical protein